MTKDLANIDQCLEGQAFLRNQIEEWKKINAHISDDYVKTTLTNLNKIYYELDQVIQQLKTTK